MNENKIMVLQNLCHSNQKILVTKESKTQNETQSWQKEK
jgi:hypothetical protein